MQTTFKKWLWSAGEHINVKTAPGVLLGKQFWKLSLISQIESTAASCVKQIW